MSTPAFRVIADGADITATLQDRLVSLRLRDEAGMQSDTLDLSLDDRDGRIQLPRTGAELRVSLGYRETGLVYMGAYTVDEIELSGPPDQMDIRARAADFRASLKAPKTRPWHDTTLGDLVETVATEHGYTARISAALAATPLDHVDQTDESDIHLITRLARQHGATAKPANGFLIFTGKGELKSPTEKPLPTTELTREGVTGWRASLPERGKYPSVTASYHDKDEAQKMSVTVGSGSPVYSLRRNYPTEGQARNAAQAKLDAFNRGLATFEATLPGRPSLAAEGALSVSGFRSGVNGTWAIKTVDHVLDGSGYICTVEAEVPKR